MKFQISVIMILQLCFLTLFAQENGELPLTQQYQTAVRQARSAHEARTEQLMQMYTAHLDRLIESARPRGEIEKIVLYLDEKENPGVGDTPRELLSVRQSLTQQRERLENELQKELLRIETYYANALEREIQEKTRAGDIGRAVALTEILKESRERLALLEPGDEEDQPTTRDLRLGPNILRDGNLDDANEDHWRFTVPGERNRTGFHTESRQEAGGQRNKVLRFQQDERRAAGVSRSINLKANTTYLVRWRVRLNAPWRHGIELRGKGTYNIGLRIPSRTWQRLPEARRLQLRPVAQRGFYLPDNTQWRVMETRLLAREEMSEFFISVSSGEGDLLIDDIEIMEILPDE
ncbi:MAG: hypothetical protein JJU29_20635 [Verrucomicrobia bacterium]|nr:hypothetical protein [Verrucomicrobiota bacterium]MCH8514626.1 hypothetical protein [Kiritimatiellia bacterium]